MRYDSVAGYSCYYNDLPIPIYLMKCHIFLNRTRRHKQCGLCSSRELGWMVGSCHGVIIKSNYIILLCLWMWQRNQTCVHSSSASVWSPEEVQTIKTERSWKKGRMLGSHAESWGHTQEGVGLAWPGRFSRVNLCTGVIWNIHTVLSDSDW